MFFPKKTVERGKIIFFLGQISISESRAHATDGVDFAVTITAIDR